MYVAIWEPEKMLVHSKKQAQVRALLFNKAFTGVSVEYSIYSNVFSVENAAELWENIGIKNHAIKLEGDKEPLFGSVYSLKSIEPKTLKTYIEINLANGFIRPFKSLTRAPILFNKKSDRSLRFCVNYCGFNNIIIKNRYLLPLISESLDRLGWARRFTQLDFINAYYWMRIWENDK